MTQRTCPVCRMSFVPTRPVVPGVGARSDAVSGRTWRGRPAPQGVTAIRHLMTKDQVPGKLRDVAVHNPFGGSQVAGARIPPPY